MDIKYRFLRVYAILPLGVRNEIVVVLDPPIGPITWEAAYVEVTNDTPTSHIILRKLDELQLI